MVNMEKKRCTWNEIKEQYSDQFVGLVDVVRSKKGINVEAAVVAFSENVDGKNIIAEKSVNGEVYMIHTSIDDDVDMGVLSW